MIVSTCSDLSFAPEFAYLPTHAVLPLFVEEGCKMFVLLAKKEKKYLEETFAIII